MPPKGEVFLLDSGGPESASRFPQARSVPSNSRTIYVSGIVAVLSDGSVAGTDNSSVPDVRIQTARILKTIDDTIRGASGGKRVIANIVDAVIYLTEMERDYAGMNEEWNKVLASRTVAPARATIGVKDLPDRRFVVEVKGVAHVAEWECMDKT
jgi:2-aminomuconate deaminase